MKIFKYWARESTSHTSKDGQPLWLTKLAGSNESVASAKVAAAKALDALKARFDSGEGLRNSGTYNYAANGEIREQVIQTFENDKGEPIAAITRNRYGSLVLNAANVLFADVDYPALPGTGLFASIARLFGRGESLATRLQARRDDPLGKVKAFADTRPKLGLRVYETHSGLRVVVTNKLFDPASEDSKTLLTQLDSDPLFQTLCQNQNCYRARLTIKPWRADLDRPPSVFPITDAKDETRFRDWLKKYDAANTQFTVCRQVAECGPEGALEEVATILSIHDKHAVSKSGLPFA